MIEQKRRKPYIGITGFMNRKEIISILSLMPEFSERLLMVGVLISQKTIKGLPNRQINRYPKIEDIMNIFLEHPQALNLLHYNTRELFTLCEQLVEITELGIKNLHGFQLNIPWPDPKELSKFRSLYPDMQIVLQVRVQTLHRMKNSPDRLALYLLKYRDVVDYILLDASCGTGTSLDVKEIQKYLEVLSEETSGMGIGVAGGLSPTTLHLIEPLLRKYPCLSFDAEGCIRDELDNLNLKSAGEYYQKGIEISSSV